MIESKNRRRFLSSLVAVLLLALFLFCGKDSWLLREAVVSVGLKTSVPQTCRVFWTERAGEPFVSERSESVRVNGRGVSASFRISANRVETLRIDFGNGAGTVRAGPVLVSGKDERVLDWNDFAERHDIARFDVDAKRAVDIEPAGEHPRAVHAKPVGVSARIRICAFPMLCLVLLSALVWFSLAGPRGLFWNASPSQGETVCTKAFLMLATLLVVARFAISFRIPAWFTGSPWDDLWFFRAASSLLDGRWLGPYDQHTLIKGMCGPAILAASSLSGVPYLVGETALYVLSSLFFLTVAARISRNRLFLLCSLALLLFNPLSTSLGAFRFSSDYSYPLNTIGKNEAMAALLSETAAGRVFGLGRWGEWQHYNTDVVVERALALAGRITDGLA